MSLRGERLGAAVSRGELTLLLKLPKPARSMTVPATFVSDRKATCVLPPSQAVGVATLTLLLPDGKGGCVKPGATNTAGGTAKAEPVGGGGEMGGAVSGGSTVASPNGVSGDGGNGGAAVVSFTYYSPNYAAHKLKPGTGPTSGGTAVRMLGTGFMNTGEMTVCVRQRGVERRASAFISEFEVRFLAPSFAEEGDEGVAVTQWAGVRARDGACVHVSSGGRGLRSLLGRSDK